MRDSKGKFGVFQFLVIFQNIIEAKVNFLYQRVLRLYGTDYNIVDPAERTFSQKFILAMRDAIIILDKAGNFFEWKHERVCKKIKSNVEQKIFLFGYIDIIIHMLYNSVLPIRITFPPKKTRPTRR